MLQNYSISQKNYSIILFSHLFVKVDPNEQYQERARIEEKFIPSEE